LVWPSPARLRGGVKRGQRNVDVANLHRTTRALYMSFSEVEARQGQDGS
jgi:hypothetical protein